MTAQQPIQLQQVKNSGGAVTSPQQVTAGFFNQQSFELMMRIAKGFAGSSLVPKNFQNNVGDCMIAINLANRIGGDPLMVMQNLIIVHGKPTWSAQYLISTANMCGRFTAIRFEFFGEKDTDKWGCRAWAIEHSTGEKLVGSDVTIGIAKKEGWFGKNGSKWQSIPQQMLMYRAGAWWVRAYAPELSMGLQTAEEVTDVYDAKKDSAGSYSVDIDSLKTPENEEDAQHEAPEDNNVTNPEPQDPGANQEAKQPEQQTDAPAPEEKPQPRQRRSRNTEYGME